MSLTRAYTWVASVGLFLQGASTLIALLVPAVDRAIPFLLHETQMIPSHSALHIASGVIGFLVLAFGGAVGASRFSLWFGLFYAALGAGGALTGQRFGLGLKPFDHPFHLVLGGVGLLAVAIESIRARTAARSNA
jgi:hypothetical protein